MVCDGLKSSSNYIDPLKKHGRQGVGIILILSKTWPPEGRNNIDRKNMATREWDQFIGETLKKIFFSKTT